MGTAWEYRQIRVTVLGYNPDRWRAWVDGDKGSDWGEVLRWWGDEGWELSSLAPYEAGGLLAVFKRPK